MRGAVGSQIKIELNVSTCASEDREHLERLRSTGRSAEADNLEAQEHKRRGKMVGVAPSEQLQETE